MWGFRNGVPMAAAAAAARAANAACAAEAGGSRWRWRWAPASLPGPGGGRSLPRPQCPAGGCRALHASGSLCGGGGARNLLRKLLNKHKKKKSWYKSPAVGSHLVHVPPSLKSTLNLAPPKFKKEDSLRKRTLDILLLKAVRELLYTCEAGQEVYDLNIELSKASLTSDLSICRMYWKSIGTAEQDEYADKVLQKCAPRVRYYELALRWPEDVDTGHNCWMEKRGFCQVMGNVPVILFVRDKGDAAVREVEKLLAIADFGPEEEEEEEEEENKLMQNDFREQRSTEAATYLDTNLFGIDHDALNKQIIEYKKREEDASIEGIGLSEQQQRQLAEIRRQKKLKWKKAKKRFDDGITLQQYLMDKISEDYWDSEVSSSQVTELEYEIQESEDKLEGENRTTKPNTEWTIKRNYEY